MIKLGNNNIGKIYLGINAIGKAYLGGHLVYQSGSGPIPQTSIPYIRGGGNGSYIDTGITADNTTRVVVWAKNVNPGTVFFFGSRVAYQNAAFGLVTDGLNNAGRIRIDYGSVSYNEDNQLNKLSDYHKYELDKGVLKIDDEIISSVTSSSFNNNKSIHLFGINNNGSHSNASMPIDISAAQIYKGDTLVRDYTAVDSPSIGLYDSISGTLFTNSGSGSFSYGTFKTTDYTRLQYIECSGLQYFDSGVSGGYANSICCICRPTATTAHMYDILGVANTSTGSCRFTIGEASSLNKTLYFGMGNTISASTMYNSINPRLSNKDITIVKWANSSQAVTYENYEIIGNNVTLTTTTDFVTNTTMYIGGVRDFDLSSRAFIGRFYNVSFGTNTNFIPAKVNNIAGLYETISGNFYPSTSGTNFVAGPTV